jgi:fatty acid-binding protein DegV
MRALVDKVKEGPVEKLSVLQGDAPDVDELLELLEPVVARSEIVVGQIGPVIGTHGGPRVLGVTFQQPHA